MIIRRRNYGRNGHGYVDENGLKVPGVTTILKNGIPKAALIGWAARVTADYAVDHWAELNEMTVSERLRTLDKAHNLVRTTAAGKGTKLHKVLDGIARDGHADYPVELEARVLNGMAFMEAFGAEVTYSEFGLYSETYRYAGTGDWGGTLLTGVDNGNGPTPQSWLLDWKPKVWPDHVLQLAAYRYGEFLLTPDGPITMPEFDRTGVVSITDEGWELTEVAAGPEAFEVFRHAQHIAHFTENGREFIGEPVEAPVPVEGADTTEWDRWDEEMK